MYDETRPDVEVTLRVPFQAVPVDRTAAGAAALSSEAGVHASADWGALLMDGVNTVYRPFVPGLL